MKLYSNSKHVNCCSGLIAYSLLGVPYQFLITFFTLYSYQQSVCEVLFFAVSARVCSVVANCSSDEGVRLKRYAVKSPPQK